MKIGDLVTRKSYNNDINFKLIDLENDVAILSSIDYRLIADSNLSDLKYSYTRQAVEESKNFINEFKNNHIKNLIIPKPKLINEDSIKKTPPPPIIAAEKYGIVLHIDGDPFYLNISLTQYKKLGVHAIGVSMEESKQPEKMLDLLKRYKPNILVVTGHDSLKKNAESSMDMNDYENSKYFVESVKIAREYNVNYDELVIIAGGCKSHYEELMKAGANFASSPNRKLINIIDPVNVACKLSITSVRNYLDVDSLYNDVLSGFGSIGGIETRGQCRLIKPKF